MEDQADNPVHRTETMSNLSPETSSQRPDTSNQCPKTRPSRGTRNGSDKHMWTAAEKKAVEQYFETNIRLEKVPGKLECLNVQRKCSSLNTLSWKKIKFAVYNRIKSKRNAQNFD